MGRYSHIPHNCISANDTLLHDQWWSSQIVFSSDTIAILVCITLWCFQSDLSECTLTLSNYDCRMPKGINEAHQRVKSSNLPTGIRKRGQGWVASSSALATWQKHCTPTRWLWPQTLMSPSPEGWLRDCKDYILAHRRHPLAETRGGPWDLLYMGIMPSIRQGSTLII